MKGRIGEATKIHQQTILQHPDYFFAKICTALNYYDQKQFSKMPGLLGENLELDILYPEKKIFHASEVMNYYKVVALYLNAVDKTNKAWDIIAKMENACPGHPEIKEATEEIFRFNLANWPERRKKEKESEIKIDGVFTQSVPETNTAPVFENKLIEELGKFNFSLPEAILQQILLIPDESLKKDLQKALKNSIGRYQYFMEHKELPGETSFFLIHAVFIIAEKKWADLLPDIINVLKNGKSFNEFYFGDTLPSLVWIAWYKLGDVNPQPLFDFLKERNIDTSGRTGINKALVQLYWQQKELQQQIINGYKELVAYFIENKNDSTLIDTIVFASTVCAMRDISLDELQNEIRRLFENKLIAIGYVRDFESLISYGKTESEIIEKVPGMYEMYENAVATWSGYKEEKYGDDWEKQKQRIERIEAKIGRNEPCHCGSGKKFKKCCLKDY